MSYRAANTSDLRQSTNILLSTKQQTSGAGLVPMRIHEDDSKDEYKDTDLSDLNNQISIDQEADTDFVASDFSGLKLEESFCPEELSLSDDYQRSFKENPTKKCLLHLQLDKMTIDRSAQYLNLFYRRPDYAEQYKRLKLYFERLFIETDDTIVLGLNFKIDNPGCIYEFTGDSQPCFYFTVSVDRKKYSELNDSDILRWPVNIQTTIIGASKVCQTMNETFNIGRIHFWIKFDMSVIKNEHKGTYDEKQLQSLKLTTNVYPIVRQIMATKEDYRHNLQEKSTKKNENAIIPNTLPISPLPDGEKIGTPKKIVMRIPTRRKSNNNHGEPTTTNTTMTLTTTVSTLTKSPQEKEPVLNKIIVKDNQKTLDSYLNQKNQTDKQGGPELNAISLTESNLKRKLDNNNNISESNEPSKKKPKLAIRSVGLSVTNKQTQQPAAEHKNNESSGSHITLNTSSDGSVDSTGVVEQSVPLSSPQLLKELDKKKLVGEMDQLIFLYKRYIPEIASIRDIDAKEEKESLHILKSLVDQVLDEDENLVVKNVDQILMDISEYMDKASKPALDRNIEIKRGAIIHALICWLRVEVHNQFIEHPDYLLNAKIQYKDQTSSATITSFKKQQIAKFAAKSNNFPLKQTIRNARLAEVFPSAFTEFLNTVQHFEKSNTPQRSINNVVSYLRYLNSIYQNAQAESVNRFLFNTQQSFVNLTPEIFAKLNNNVNTYWPWNDEKRFLTPDMTDIRVLEIEVLENSPSSAISTDSGDTTKVNSYYILLKAGLHKKEVESLLLFYVDVVSFFFRIQRIEIPKFIQKAYQFYEHKTKQIFAQIKNNKENDERDPLQSSKMNKIQPPTLHPGDNFFLYFMTGTVLGNNFNLENDNSNMMTIDGDPENTFADTSNLDKTTFLGLVKKVKRELFIRLVLLTKL